MIGTKRIALALGAIGLAVAALAPAARAGSSEYFPLHRGDTWTYAVSPPPGYGMPTRLITNTVDKVAGSPFVGRWYHLTEYQGSDHWVTETALHRVYEAPAELWYRLGTAPGTTWTMAINGPSNGATLTLATRTETVTVTAGTFADCIRIDYASSTPGIASEWFAPGVGLVKRTEGILTTTLQSAKVGGTVYPLPSLVATLTVTPDTIAIGGAAPPPGSPPRTYQVTATLHVASTGAPITVTQGGFAFDFVLKDASGNVAWRWSTGRQFPQYVMRRTIDQTGVDYTATFNLTGAPIGNDTIEGISMLRPAPAPASAPFTVLAAP
jgi:hypothetical protein